MSLTVVEHCFPLAEGKDRAETHVWNDFDLTLLGKDDTRGCVIVAMLGFSQLQKHVDGVVVETLCAREDEEIAFGWLADEGILVIIAKLENPVLAGHFEATLILISERNQRGQWAQG